MPNMPANTYASRPIGWLSLFLETTIHSSGGSSHSSFKVVRPRVVRRLVLSTTKKKSDKINYYRTLNNYHKQELLTHLSITAFKLVWITFSIVAFPKRLFRMVKESVAEVSAGSGSEQVWTIFKPFNLFLGILSTTILN